MLLSGLAAALASVPSGAAARVLLLANGGAVPGELGYLMAGAQVALASGGESLFANPAGLAHERGSRLTVSGDLLRAQSTTLDDSSSDTLDTALGSAAYAHALGDRRGHPRFTLGLGLVRSEDQRRPTQFSGQRQGTAADLPPGSDTTGVDAAFPDGLTLRESGDALGELRVLAPAVGLGLAPADWVRLGAAVRIERISLSQRETATTTYRADAGANTLSGQSQRAWVLGGEAQRLAWSLGLQLDVTRGVVLGLALLLPARTMEGSGRRLYQRSDAFSGSGAPLLPSEGTISIASEGLPFRLDAPRATQLGLAFTSDRFLLELDVRHSAAQDPYEVLPGADNPPPFTLAYELPALRTSRVSTMGYALGMAYARSERTSLLLGLALEPSPVPADDPLFRKVDTVSVSAGAYHVRGDLSGSLGLVWREGREAAATFAAQDGAAPVTASIAIREVAVRMGASVAF